MKTLLPVGLLLLCCSLRASGQDSTAFKPSLRFNGYLKAMPSVTWSPLLEQHHVSGLLHNRLNFHARPAQHLRAAVELRNRAFTGDQVRLDPRLGNNLAEDAGLVDMSWTWIDTKTVVVHTIVDRAWLAYERGHFALRAGRQRINWGVDLVWNPNDLFNAYNYLDFDYEERPGSDAVSLKYYTGVSGQAEVALKADSARNVIAAGMYRFHVGSYDLQVLGGKYGDYTAVGTGWAGNLGSSGLKGEATAFFPRKDAPSGDRKTSVSVSSTVDHSFRKGLYLMASALYESQGAARPEAVNTTDVLARQVSPRLLMPFRFTGLLSARYTFNPIFSGTLTVMGAPGTKSLIGFPSASASLGNNWQLDAYFQGYWQQLPVLGFKNIANAGYLRLKWSF